MLKFLNKKDDFLKNNKGLEKPISYGYCHNDWYDYKNSIKYETDKS